MTVTIDSIVDAVDASNPLAAGTQLKCVMSDPEQKNPQDVRMSLLDSAPDGTEVSSNVLGDFGATKVGDNWECTSLTIPTNPPASLFVVAYYLDPADNKWHFSHSVQIVISGVVQTIPIISEPPGVIEVPLEEEEVIGN